MTIDTSREAVERILENVTPGPWAWAENHPLNACANVTAEAISGWTIDIATLYGGSDDVPNPSAPDEPWGDHPIRRANASFISAARDLVPALLAERDAALAEVARLKTDRDNGAKDYCALMERHDALQVEVARLSTPPDDAEVRVLESWLRSPWLSAKDNVDRGPIPDWLYALLQQAADDLTRLYHAHAAERKLADDLARAGGFARTALSGLIRPEIAINALDSVLDAHAARRKPLTKGCLHTTPCTCGEPE